MFLDLWVKVIKGCHEILAQFVCRCGNKGNLCHLCNFSEPMMGHPHPNSVAFWVNLRGNYALVFHFTDKGVWPRKLLQPILKSLALDVDIFPYPFNGWCNDRESF